MSNNSQMIMVQGVLEPKLLNARERKRIPGVEDRYEITRTGRIWSAAKKGFMVDAYHPIFTVTGQRIYADSNFLVALTWLSSEVRDEIRTSHKASSQNGGWPAEKLRFVEQLRVSRYGIDAALKYSEQVFQPVTVVKQRFGQVVP